MTELLDVLAFDPSDSIVRAVAFGLPAAVLLTLLVLWRVNARTKSEKTGVLEHAAPVADRGADPAAPEPSAVEHAVDVTPSERAKVFAVPDSVSNAQLAPIAAPAMRFVPSPAPHAPALPESKAAEPDAQAPTAQTAPAAPLDFASIKAQFDEAVKSAPKTALAPLYLEYARQCRKSGDEAACLAALRSAAGYGALHGPRVAHAAARVELAEAAFTSGDAIGACEQWQIARLVLHEEGLKDAYAGVDKRMRDNGCPTDWVLTDF